MTRTTERPTGVYLLTPDWTDTGRLLAVTAAAVAGGVRWLQYRNKRADSALRRTQAKALRELTLTHGARLVINDDVDLAITSLADGVHVGRDDADPQPKLAREGIRMLVGVSCYDDFDRARLAARNGADYVAFGSVYASATKPAAVRAPLSLLGRARAEGMHVVAIGGIDATNIKAVGHAGAHAAALIAAVYDAADPAAAVRELTTQFEQGKDLYESQRAAV
ncbi:MAG: thiamine phosphate synthase [Gemmatimonadota bacterium]